MKDSIYDSGSSNVVIGGPLDGWNKNTNIGTYNQQSKGTLYSLEKKKVLLSAVLSNERNVEPHCTQLTNQVSPIIKIT